MHGEKEALILANRALDERINELAQPGNHSLMALRPFHNRPDTSIIRASYNAAG